MADPVSAEDVARAEKLVADWKLHVARNVWGYSEEIAKDVHVPAHDLVEFILRWGREEQIRALERVAENCTFSFGTRTYVEHEIARLRSEGDAGPGKGE